MIPVTNLKHKFANVHNKKVSLHKNTGKTSMMGSSPVGQLYRLIMQQILQRNDTYSDTYLHKL